MTLDPLRRLQYLVTHYIRRVYLAGREITSVYNEYSYFKFLLFHTYALPYLLNDRQNICVKSSMKYLQNWNFRSTYHAYLDAIKAIRPKNTSNLVLVKTGHINISYNTFLKMFRDHLVGHKLCMFIYSHNRHTPG